jgi:putative endonuclease
MSDRVRSWRRGLRAERLAAGWLRLKGYRILASRLRTPAGELDLVARRGDVLAFVEVKARGDAAAALAAVSTRQQQRIARAAEAFCATHPGLAGKTLRFDVMVVLPKRLPKHIMDAWRP